MVDCDHDRTELITVDFDTLDSPTRYSVGRITFSFYTACNSLFYLSCNSVGLHIFGIYQTLRIQSKLECTICKYCYMHTVSMATSGN